MRTFRIKTWLKELPTIGKLHERKPEIYKNNRCKICSKFDDTTFILSHMVLTFNTSEINTQPSYQKNVQPELMETHKRERSTPDGKTHNYIQNMKVKQSHGTKQNG
jgi:hypothetical protein